MLQPAGAVEALVPEALVQRRDLDLAAARRRVDEAVVAEVDAYVQDLTIELKELLRTAGSVILK